MAQYLREARCSSWMSLLAPSGHAEMAQYVLTGSTVVEFYEFFQLLFAVV
jgi:hypothetical protein